MAGINNTKRALSAALLLLMGLSFALSAQARKIKQFSADHPYIRFTGRVDFTNKKLPRFWQPGVYIEISFSGSTCELILNDEVLWGNSHNYYEIVLDGKATRHRMQKGTDTLNLSAGLSRGKHTLVIAKNTEANIGWMELAAIRCEKLLPPAPAPIRKIEFIGNSITSGTGADLSEIACGKGVWQDQHNAWMSYGGLTARSLNAQFHLSAVSGIGLMHSCCNMGITMPRVFDKVNMRNDTINWDFSKYQPDIVTVCLGQNDGIQDSTTFVHNYLGFLERLRTFYPLAVIICLTSPMAHKELAQFQLGVVRAVSTARRAAGDSRVFSFAFTRQYSSGCDGHPDMAEHGAIADELTKFIRKELGW